MKKRGFTLIELLAVIVILALIALIVTPVVTRIIESAKKSAAIDSALGYIDAVEKYTLMYQFSPDKYNKLESNTKYFIIEDSSLLSEEDEEDEENIFPVGILYLKEFINIGGQYPEDGYIIMGEKNSVSNSVFIINGYKVTCEGKTCGAEKNTSKDTVSYWTEVICNDNVCEASNILSIINNETLTSGYYTFKVTGKNDSAVEEVKEYPVHLYVLDGNQTISTETIYGDVNDVSNGTDYASNMVIVKVNGDLTVTENGIIKPYSDTFGGPKGFALFVTGKLNNKGTIDNSHGAYAVGENVYLWDNGDGTWEYVPADGAAGTGNGAQHTSGSTGNSATGRQTGGGGGGANPSYYGAGGGATGTSYSGGSGGGAANNCWPGGSSSGPAKPASTNGGAGGVACGSNTSTGAGNPSGGTGGLLVIYANEYINEGIISANGHQSTAATYKGGSSGGGSINIFTNKKIVINQLGDIIDSKYEQIKGNVDTTSSISADSYHGGAGGTGSVNIGEIKNGKYYDLKEVIQQKIDKYIEKHSLTGDSILSILKNNNLETGYYTFTINGKNNSGVEESIVYSINLISYSDLTVNEEMIFGNEIDASNGTSFAQSMVVVKVNGNLNVTETGIMRPVFTQYGGPKGFLVYVTGTLTNNGIIENNKGAYAAGENVYLLANSDDTWEYVPADGAAGKGNGSQHTSGSTGTAGTGRQTGGGGGGANPSYYGAGGGATGTSYSGGSGGGAANNCWPGGSSGGPAKPASTNGGAGGVACGSNTSAGAGNPSGGTGGLLIIYGNNINNNNTIQANGSMSVQTLYSGGSSGGGSVNIFYSNEFVQGNILALGGQGTNSSYAGGKGGAGTVTIKKIEG